MKPERKKGKNRWHKAGRKITNGNERFQTSALFKLADWLKTNQRVSSNKFYIELDSNYKIQFTEFIWVWNWILIQRINNFYRV